MSFQAKLPVSSPQHLACPSYVLQTCFLFLFYAWRKHGLCKAKPAPLHAAKDPTTLMHTLSQGKGTKSLMHLQMIILGHILPLLCGNIPYCGCEGWKSAITIPAPLSQPAVARGRPHSQHAEAVDSRDALAVPQQVAAIGARSQEQLLSSLAGDAPVVDGQRIHAGAVASSPCTRRCLQLLLSCALPSASPSPWQM